MGAEKNTKTPTQKATIYLSFRRFIIDRLGNDFFEKVLGELKEGDRLILAETELATDVIPEVLFCDLLLSTKSLLPDNIDSKELFYESGVFVASKDIPRFFYLMVPLRCVHIGYKFSGIVWRMYHTHGDLKAELINDHSGRITLEDFPVSTKPFCHCIAGYLAGSHEVGGYKLRKPVEEVECVLDGARHCRYHIEWE